LDEEEPTVRSTQTHARPADAVDHFTTWAYRRLEVIWGARMVSEVPDIVLYFLLEKYNQGGEAMEVKISTKGWVVIPAKLREKYNLKPGDQVHVVDYGGVVSIVPASVDPVKHAAGMLKGKGSLTKAILEEHRKERTRGR